MIMRLFLLMLFCAHRIHDPYFPNVHTYILVRCGCEYKERERDANRIMHLLDDDQKYMYGEMRR